MIVSKSNLEKIDDINILYKTIDIDKDIDVVEYEYESSYSVKLKLPLTSGEQLFTLSIDKQKNAIDILNADIANLLGVLKSMLLEKVYEQEKLEQ